MELVNEIYATMNNSSISTEEIKEATQTVVLLLSPFTPHICEEMWKRLGEKSSISSAAWPKYNPEFIQQDTLSIVIQVNGKVRSKVDVPADTHDDRLKELVLANERVKKWLENKAIKNIIIVPKKLINIVI